MTVTPEVIMKLLNSNEGELSTRGEPVKKMDLEAFLLLSFSLSHL